MVSAFTPVAQSVFELPPVTLVLGGARSGKSAWAESLIEQQMGNVWDGATYLATATAEDAFNLASSTVDIPYLQFPLE